MSLVCDCEILSNLYFLFQNIKRYFKVKLLKYFLSTLLTNCLPGFSFSKIDNCFNHITISKEESNITEITSGCTSHRLELR